MSTSELRRKAGANEQVLSQYDEPVMDEQGMCYCNSHAEQEQVIDSIRESNEKSNYWYRAALLVIYALIVVLYVTYADLGI